MISVCIITKNEEKHLKECLKRIYGKGFEIIVVDTGSTDNSIEVAKKFTDNVYNFEWCDDFSAARNYSIEKASSDYILILDSDEYLEECKIKQLERALEQNPDKTGRILIENEYMSNNSKMISEDRVSRLFVRRYFYYTGRIHEQLTRKNGEDHQTYDANLRVHHCGYMGNEEERKNKAERNLNLLIKEFEENEKDPYIMYQIGKSYYYMQIYNEAVKYFEMAMDQNLNLKLEYVADMVVIYGYSLINTNQLQKALRLEALFDDYRNNADFLFVLALIFMKNGKFDLAVQLFLQATKCSECSVKGVNSYSAFYNIGVIYECLGDKKTALNYYSKCGNYQPAKEGKKRCR